MSQDSGRLSTGSSRGSSGGGGGGGGGGSARGRGSRQGQAAMPEGMPPWIYRLRWKSVELPGIQFSGNPPKPRLLASITDDDANTVGRAATADGDQNDHSTAHVTLVYFLTNFFRDPDLSMEGKRAKLCHAMDRLSVLAVGGSGEVIDELGESIQKAFDEYNAARQSKRSQRVLCKAYGEIDVVNQLNDYQFQEIKKILLDHVRSGSDVRNVIPDIVRFICEDEGPRTDGKKSELVAKLQDAIDHGELSFEDLMDDIEESGDEMVHYEVDIVMEVIKEAGLSIVQAHNQQEAAGQRERILKMQRFCEKVSVATLTFYNQLELVAFRKCKKLPKILHNGKKKVLERYAVKNMNERYLGKNRLKSEEGKRLNPAKLEEEIGRIEKAIRELHEVSGRITAARRRKKSRVASAYIGGGGGGASAQQMTNPPRKARILRRFAPRRDELQCYLDVLLANRPEEVARDLYGLLDYRKRIMPGDLQAAAAGGGASAQADEPDSDSDSDSDNDSDAAAAAPSAAIRTNDEGIWHNVLARHLYVVLSAYPQMGLQYGYDIRKPRKKRARFWDAVLTPFFEWVCADWEITSQSGVKDVMREVGKKLFCLLEAKGKPRLKAIVRSGRSSGNNTEASEGSASGRDSDLGAPASDGGSSDVSIFTGDDADEDADAGMDAVEGVDDVEDDDASSASPGAH